MKRLLIGIALVGQSLLAAAQGAFEDLTMNGLAVYEQLRDEYYIGALFLETLSSDPQTIRDMEGYKRMDLRITTDQWSPRRFAQQWNQAILINNSEEAQQQLAEEIINFTNLPIEALVAGDRIQVDYSPEDGTVVSLNGTEMLSSKGEALFELILNTWIGARPPSSEFKRDILTMPSGQEAQTVVLRFEALAPTQERKKEIARWAAASETEVAVSAPGRGADADGGVGAPPAGGATVSRARSSSPEPSRPAQRPEPQRAEVEKPQLEKPRLASNSSQAEEKKPEPKPKPKPEPKPEKTAKAKDDAEAKKAAAAARRQAALMKAYRSNVLKMTYLNTEYPKRSLDLRQEGLVVVKLTLDREGKILDLKLDQKSDHGLLNRAAERAVRESAPFPEAPSILEGEQFEMLLPFNFKLGG